MWGGGRSREELMLFRCRGLPVVFYPAPAQRGARVVGWITNVGRGKSREKRKIIGKKREKNTLGVRRTREKGASGRPNCP